MNSPAFTVNPQP